MKKIIYLFIFFILLFNFNACTGYKPIFSTSNLNFKISDYSIEGNKKLGREIYSRLYSLSGSAEKTEAQNIKILINVSKDKKATVKDTAGKVLEYRITLSTNIVVKKYLTGATLLEENFISSSSYKVQDQYSETIKLENMSLENLINKTYEDLLLKLIQII